MPRPTPAPSPRTSTNAAEIVVGNLVGQHPEQLAVLRALEQATGHVELAAPAWAALMPGSSMSSPAALLNYTS